MVYTDPDEVPWSAYLALAAITAIVVAALLPWYAEGGQSATGLDVDNGSVTAGAALAALGLLIAYEWGLTAQLGAILAGVVSVGLGYDIWNQVAADADLDPTFGLYLSLLGGAALVGVGVYSLVEAHWLADDSDGDGTTNRIVE